MKTIQNRFLNSNKDNTHILIQWNQTAASCAVHSPHQLWMLKTYKSEHLCLHCNVTMR